MLLFTASRRGSEGSDPIFGHAPHFRVGSCRIYCSGVLRWGVVDWERSPAKCLIICQFRCPAVPRTQIGTSSVFSNLRAAYDCVINTPTLNSESRRADAHTLTRRLQALARHKNSKFRKYPVKVAFWPSTLPNEHRPNEPARLVDKAGKQQHPDKDFLAQEKVVINAALDFTFLFSRHDDLRHFLLVGTACLVKAAASSSA